MRPKFLPGERIGSWVIVGRTRTDARSQPRTILELKCDGCGHVTAVQSTHVSERGTPTCRCKKTVAARFWSRVDMSGGPDACWPWTGSYRGAYGQFSVGRNSRRSHRMAWVLTNGEIPRGSGYHGMCVCHKCDNPKCCNPGHLFLGTTQENTADRDRKGRGARGDECIQKHILRGEEHPNYGNPSGHMLGAEHHQAKLTEVQVIEIRRAYGSGAATQTELGKRFGVQHTTIGMIVRGQTWKHIPIMPDAANDQAAE